MRNLQSWITDLVARVNFINDWISHGIPKVFWFSGLFSPQGFLTAILQNFSRSHGIPIDSVTYDFKIISRTEDRITDRPEDGAFIKGV